MGMLLIAYLTLAYIFLELSSENYSNLGHTGRIFAKNSVSKSPVSKIEAPLNEI
jgi:hypothetical protein